MRTLLVVPAVALVFGFLDMSRGADTAGLADPAKWVEGAASAEPAGNGSPSCCNEGVPVLSAVVEAPAAPTVMRRADLPLTQEYQAHLSPFPLRVGVGGETVTVRRRVFGLPVLPGARVTISAPGSEELALDAGPGTVRREGGPWVWTAPHEPGLHAVRVTGPNGRWIHLNLLVMEPWAGSSQPSLRGYRIGEYRARPHNRGPEYEPPGGFVVVAADDRDVLVSPHVTLGDLLCKQPGEPRLVHYTPHLIRKLEAVLQEANRQGIRAPALTLMSAYRTPAYNLAIGNRTFLSRHLWGDAADIYIDVDGDGIMDDLNQDGRQDRRDAEHLAAIVDDMMGRRSADVPAGGMSVYGSNAAHGAFVHVDARGQRARW
ncbi:MAG: hypothetical protein HKN73_13310 [Gemmatimonadetes bacterium]|nr:hypothetical protein [Gemmatimonadota bacterium]